MTIEQDFMRIMKIDGGLIGRGFTDSTVIKWVLGIPSTYDICQQVEDFCRIKFSTTEQHVDARDSRINRDSVDIKKIVQWFDSHEPFPFQKAVMSIATGVIGGETINYYDAFEVGKASLDKIIGQNIANIKFKRKDRVMPVSYTHLDVYKRQVTYLFIYYTYLLSGRSRSDATAHDEVTYLHL